MIKPLITFYRLAPHAPKPKKADESLQGTMPLRAFRYCEPLVSASGFGWHLFPPIDFCLVWDGYSFKWSPNEGETWYELTNAQIPGLNHHLDENVPKEYSKLSPPFLAALPEAGVVQIWSGYFAKTRPKWSLLVRGLSNIFHSRAYECMEGIVETDWWSGPVFTNFIFKKTNAVVHFKKDVPFFQVQPIPQHVYSKKTLEQVRVVEELREITIEDWESYSKAVLPNGGKTEPGTYSKIVRKKRNS